MKSDQPLLKAIRITDQEALVAIFDRYAPELYNYALGMCGDPLEADQTVGDVFTKFLEQIAAGKGPHTNLRSYLYTMTTHVILDNWRLSGRNAPLELAMVGPITGDGNISMDERMENKVLYEALILAVKHQLTANQRHLILLRFVEGFSLLETARIVGKEVGYVKTTQNRAIAKLRKVLA